ncbi:MAG: hypothetical protein JW778_07990 [Candidatus Altiarchaeota archaeon]|nr:hypothetical protein [Candidatus Altiarchaeota archaeon]
MTELLTSDKDISWYLEEIISHAEEIRELYDQGDKIYRGKETCRAHARVEAYDLIVLTAEAFQLPGIIEQVPGEILERFNQKRLKQ